MTHKKKTQATRTEKKEPMMMMFKSSIDDIFLLSIGSLFTIAFLSYFVQFPGLLSSSGLEPVGRIYPAVFPKKYQYFGTSSDDVHTNWIQVEVICDIAAVAGVILSSLVAW